MAPLVFAKHAKCLSSIIRLLHLVPIDDFCQQTHNISFTRSLFYEDQSIGCGWLTMHGQVGIHDLRMDVQHGYFTSFW
ncbi:hypothetical protein I3842_09G184300 [Carya illinoinensis]|uniref:Uncharacterized protein n=1 Tax=Carya illinoinensis TaxID=32201 RepID=A0A922E7G5_CARIL|nr:hypothetical protein I3842_09G184300 [Carya illinoinensis]